MDAAAELGRNPVSKDQTQPEYGDDQLTRDGNPSREIKFSGANGDREISSFPFQQTTSKIGKLTIPVDPYTLAICDDHRYFQHAHFRPLVGVGKRGVC